MQNMLEALIRYEIIQEDEIAGSAESIVTVDCLWSLFLKVEQTLTESTANQNKELLEVISVLSAADPKLLRACCLFFSFMYVSNGFDEMLMILAIKLNKMCVVTENMVRP